MNSHEVADMMALVAYELASAESFDRKARWHRTKAMDLQGRVHAEFTAALKEFPNPSLKQTPSIPHELTT